MLYVQHHRLLKTLPVSDEETSLKMKTRLNGFRTHLKMRPSVQKPTTLINALDQKVVPAWRQSWINSALPHFSNNVYSRLSFIAFFITSHFFTKSVSLPTIYLRSIQTSLQLIYGTLPHFTLRSLSLLVFFFLCNFILHIILHIAIHFVSLLNLFHCQNHFASFLL